MKVKARRKARKKPEGEAEEYEAEVGFLDARG